MTAISSLNWFVELHKMRNETIPDLVDTIIFVPFCSLILASSCSLPLSALLGAALCAAAAAALSTSFKIAFLDSS